MIKILGKRYKTILVVLGIWAVISVIVFTNVRIVDNMSKSNKALEEKIKKDYGFPYVKVNGDIRWTTRDEAYLCKGTWNEDVQALKTDYCNPIEKKPTK